MLEKKFICTRHYEHMDYDPWGEMLLLILQRTRRQQRHFSGFFAVDEPKSSSWLRKTTSGSQDVRQFEICSCSLAEPALHRSDREEKLVSAIAPAKSGVLHLTLASVPTRSCTANVHRRAQFQTPSSVRP
jgi:hypothetical protein